MDLCGKCNSDLNKWVAKELCKPCEEKVRAYLSSPQQIPQGFEKDPNLMTDLWSWFKEVYDPQLPNHSDCTKTVREVFQSLKDAGYIDEMPNQPDRIMNAKCWPKSMGSMDFHLQIDNPVTTVHFTNDNLHTPHDCKNADSCIHLNKQEKQ